VWRLVFVLLAGCETGMLQSITVGGTFGDHSSGMIVSAEVVPLAHDRRVAPRNLWMSSARRRVRAASASPRAPA
jgi:hypothetical protein